MEIHVSRARMRGTVLPRTRTPFLFRFESGLNFGGQTEIPGGELSMESTVLWCGRCFTRTDRNILIKRDIGQQQNYAWLRTGTRDHKCYSRVMLAKVR